MELLGNIKILYSSGNRIKTKQDVTHSYNGIVNVLSVTWTLNYRGNDFVSHLSHKSVSVFECSEQQV